MIAEDVRKSIESDSSTVRGICHIPGLARERKKKSLEQYILLCYDLPFRYFPVSTWPATRSFDVVTILRRSWYRLRRVHIIENRKVSRCTALYLHVYEVDEVSANLEWVSIVLVGVGIGVWRRVAEPFVETGTWLL